MDQQALRELEKRCIQEEPPLCTATCPLHVDARAFAGHIGRGDWDAAYKILNKFMPMPGILGRICDAPCESRCRRKDVEAAIVIGALERACVNAVQNVPGVLPLPPKDKRIAVVGSGLSSLTVAWDLGRKGYRVTLFEPEERLAASLFRLDPIRLPAHAVQWEIDKLTRLGVTVELHARLEEPRLWDQWMSEFDAVYLGLDAAAEVSWDVDREPDGTIRVEPKVQRTSLEKVFAGGGSVQSLSSPVFQVAEGRWAATSIDRFLQNVSITAGREKEGMQSTGLFTSIVGVTPSPREPMADAAKGYDLSEAKREAGRCLQCECLECVKVCVYLENFKGYPKKYAREIYNNAAIVMGERKANTLINSCSLCGLCERVCPNDFAMQDLCLSARNAMVSRGKMPPSAHEFALLDMAFSRGAHYSLARHAPGQSSSAHLFFPGCQLSASAPDQVEAVYAHLRSRLAGGVGLILGCCGAPALWAGQTDLFQEVITEVKRQWSDLGSPQMVLACSTCYRVFKEHLPEMPVVSLWQVLEKNLPTVDSFNSLQLAVHDPCTTRHEPEIQNAVRRIAGQIGVELQELELGRDLTECCGYGGLMQTANSTLARTVVQRRAERSRTDYLAYCAMCRDNLAGVNKRAIHLLDLLFPEKGESDPAARPRPGGSERRENRSRLKSRLLTGLWKEETVPMESYAKIRLHMTPDVAERLESRRILIEDVQQVIFHAEESGEKMVHPQTGHFRAAYAPHIVTFWVEYAPAKEGYHVYNAYAHRMEVIGP
jgi:glutamate synthase (NADPH) small chain